MFISNSYEAFWGKFIDLNFSKFRYFYKKNVFSLFCLLFLLSKKCGCSLLGGFFIESTFDIWTRQFWRNLFYTIRKILMSGAQCKTYFTCDQIIMIWVWNYFDDYNSIWDKWLAIQFILIKRNWEIESFYWNEAGSFFDNMLPKQSISFGTLQSLWADKIKKLIFIKTASKFCQFFDDF